MGHDGGRTLEGMEHRDESFSRLQNYAVDLWIKYATTERSDGGEELLHDLLHEQPG